MSAMPVDQVIVTPVVVVKESLWTRLKRSVGAFFTNLKARARTAWTWTKAHLVSAWSWTKSRALSVWSWSVAAASTVWSWATNSVRFAGRTITRTAPVVWNRTVDFASWLVRTTFALIGGALNWILATVLFGMVIEGLRVVRDWFRNSAARRDARAERRIARRDHQGEVAFHRPRGDIWVAVEEADRNVAAQIWSPHTMPRSTLRCSVRRLRSPSPTSSPTRPVVST